MRHLSSSSRRGTILVLSALMIVVLAGMLAFSIDIGYALLVRTELQRAADAAALAGTGALGNNLIGAGGYQNATPSPSVLEASAKAEAVTFALLNQSTGQTTGLVVLPSQVEVGSWQNYQFLAGTQTGNAALPYDAVRVTVLRGDDGTNNLNQPVQMFFGKMFNIQQMNMKTTATAVMQRAVGFSPGGFLIPYGLDIQVYRQLIGLDPPTAIDLADNYTYDETVPMTGPRLPLSQATATNGPWRNRVTSGGDGILEGKIFPLTSSGGGKGKGGSPGLGPGNFGSFDLGTASNGTPELRRQLVEGPNIADFHVPSFDHNTWDNPDTNIPYLFIEHPETDNQFYSGGDTGISAGTKDEWAHIIGRPTIVPLYDQFTGNGNNSSMRFVGWGGMVVTSVNLTGNPKEIWVQPAWVIDPTAAIGPGDANPNDTFNVLTPPKLVR